MDQPLLRNVGRQVGAVVVRLARDPAEVLPVDRNLQILGKAHVVVVAIELEVVVEGGLDVGAHDVLLDGLPLCPCLGLVQLFVLVLIVLDLIVLDPHLVQWDLLESTVARNAGDELDAAIPVSTGVVCLVVELLLESLVEEGLARTAAVTSIASAVAATVAMMFMFPVTLIIRVVDAQNEY